MNENKTVNQLEMVYSASAEWLDDIVQQFPVTMVDAYDAAVYMDDVLRDAMKIFLEHGLHSERSRNDAMLILRALFYEHYLFSKEHVLRLIPPNPAAVQRLPLAPQSVQKSAIWHAEARDILSGHEFGALIVGGPAERAAAIAKKCGPPISAEEGAPESRTVYTTDADGSISPFKWGWRYEPVARDLFEVLYAEGRVDDTLGRVRHQSLPRLGASPDGLIMDGPRCGRLVELKCPITRELDGTVPFRYYCQMQLQAEVCDVDAVEYFEACFGAIPEHVIAYADVKNALIPHMGKICVIADVTGFPIKYEYSPMFPTTRVGFDACIDWVPKGNIVESSVWYVKDTFKTTVIRNPRWWADVGYPAYIQFWKEVDAARAANTYGPKPLFIDEASDHEETGTVVATDVHTSAGKNTFPATSAGVWLGVE